jgi:hypothetical protein
MSQETTYRGILGDLERLNTALIANAAELPQLEGVRGQLEQLLNQAREVAQEQGTLIAQKQDASQRLVTLLRNGQRVATAVRKVLKAHYGLDSEKLAEFGVQPFRGRNRSAGSVKPPPQSPAPEVARPAPTLADPSSSES